MTENRSATAHKSFPKYLLITIIAGAVAVPILAAPSLWAFSNSSPDAVLYAVVGLIGCVIALSQDTLKRSDKYSSSKQSAKMNVLGTLLSAIYYNAIVWVAVFIGVAVASEFSQIIAVMAVVVYAFWDIETRAQGIPLSVGGLLVLSVAVLILFHRAGRRVTTKLRDAKPGEVWEWIGVVRPDVLFIMDAPEREPLRLASRRLRR